MATKMRQKKYLQHELISDHYYQNQNTNKLKSAKSKANKKNNLKSDSPIGSASVTASTSSSNRTLINDDENSESDIAFCFLTLAIFCLVFSVIAIAITFIFPFWFRLTITNPDSLSYLNVTNVDNNLTLFALPPSSSSNNVTTIFIDMGIWEVKMNQEIELIDSGNSKRYKNSYPQSMLWLNSDDSFLERFIKFINLKMSNLFIVQTLEILHLIFTFLTFTFTSFTVCLTGQANANKSLCWYFVCFIMALVAFLSGLAVIILILAWQSINSSWLRDEAGKQIIIRKELGWTFWTSVGILSLILLAGCLILIHIVIQSLISCFRNKKRSKHMKKNPNKNTNKMNYFNGIVAANPSITHEVFQANNQQNRNSGSNYSNLNNSKLPRLQPGTTTANYPPPPLSLLPTNNNNNSARNSKIENLSLRKNNNSNNVEQFLNASQQFNSPSYIFYTGHGQYRKQSISVIDPLDENQIQLQTRQQPLEYEFANDILVAHPPNTLNYTMGLNTTGSNYTNANHNLNEHHPYSNVNENNHHHNPHTHATSNQLNPNELSRYFR